MSGIALLESASGKAEGSYVNAFETEGPIVDSVDHDLFEDEDGKVCFTYGNAGPIARLKDDLSGFAA